MKLNNYIDHTILKATTTPEDVVQLCEEAKEHQFYAVCVNGCHVSLAKENLRESEAKIAAVVGFPLGAMSTKAKIAEAVDAIADGADEIDMVINIGWLKAGKDNLVQDEIFQIKKSMGTAVLKVIIETCYLTDTEKENACKAAMNAGADFVKTSTGFGTDGATFEDVQLMKRVVGNKLKIKASGGVKDLETAKKYLELGVSRIGTSSGVALVTSKKNS